ncbi:MAG: hypothetical protein JWP87_1650 [Labilithrix sp.]|nr:hypothetical protein [Labilithrix sp.]
MPRVYFFEGMDPYRANANPKNDDPAGRSRRADEDALLSGLLMAVGALGATMGLTAHRIGEGAAGVLIVLVGVWTGHAAYRRRDDRRG